MRRIRQTRIVDAGEIEEIFSCYHEGRCEDQRGVCLIQGLFRKEISFFGMAQVKSASSWSLTQVSSVDGQKYHSKRRPNIAHETCRIATRTVYWHRSTKQNGEHQPVGSKKREVVSLNMEMASVSFLFFKNNFSFIFNYRFS